MEDQPPQALTPTQAAMLRLSAAIQLLDHSGRSLPADLPAGSPQWLQALIDGLCDLSSRDPLTGLANRRQFELTLEREIDRVARSGEPALVLVADIDRFKSVNDNFGHAAGDLVLQAVGRALQQSVRPMDSVARLGGEEFAIVLPNCPPAFGLAVAERVRRRIERMPIDVGNGKQVGVTISLGGGFAPQWVRCSAKLWMERADQQLYRAKAEGRNRACLEATLHSVVSAEEKSMLFFVPTRSDDLLGPA